MKLWARNNIAKEKSFVVLPHNYEFFIHAQKNESHIHYTMSVMMSEESILKEFPDKKENEEILVK